MINFCLGDTPIRISVLSVFRVLHHFKFTRSTLKYNRFNAYCENSFIF